MKLIPNAVTRQVARKILIAQKHSPRILFVAGVAGVVTSTVLACRATLKLPEVAGELEHEIEGVKMNLHGTDGYHKDLAYVYIKGTYQIGRLYAPSVMLGVVSIGALTGSHITLTRRNASLTAAYAAVSKGFDEYRERVRTELGEEREREIYHAVTIEQMIDEDGKKVFVPVADPNRWSPYARFFDESSPNWVKNAELNRLFVQCQQNYANHLLHARGHVFLNEVYDMLGLDRCKAGQTVGWVIGHDGDNYIDFGLYEASSSRFVNGIERSILLDFNVDGVIIDNI
jgi:hypothetical protein